MAGANKVALIDEKAWSSSGNLFFPGDDGSGNAIRKSAALTLQAEFKKAGYYTLQFGIQPPPTLSNGFVLAGNVFTTAEILWSVKGNTIRRFINVYNGTTISGAGEAITVRVRDVSVPVVFVTEPLKYQVTASLIPGSRPSLANGMPPIFTPRESVVSLVAPPAEVTPPYPLPAGPDALVIAVPANCGITSVMLNIARQTNEGGDEPVNLESSQIWIEQRNSGSLLNALNYDSAYNFQPLVPGTTELHIYNQTDTTNPDDITLVWVTPIFGVDG